MPERSPSTQSSARCSLCGDVTPAAELIWTGGDEEYACKACCDDEWLEAFDVCKNGGPAPCIDDICHALGGCMLYADGA